jgi:fructose-1,6-bisphosphatase/inositol monophosphatase family enzyme
VTAARGRAGEGAGDAANRFVVAGASFAADAAFAREIAERAGLILLDRYERVGQIDHKSAKDVVTEVDHLSEALILGAIRDRFPGDGILAEESGEHKGVDESAVRSLAHGRTWIIDPLDGTVNYANGLPHFCVSVGLVVDGRPAAGAVHDPMRGETFWAAADGPAMLNDTAIHASEKERLDDYVIAMALGGRSVTTRVRAVRHAVRVARNMGSAALAMAYVARGRFDGYIQSGGMSAWDIAAAGLIAERAGAVVTDATGGPWFDVARATRTFGCVAAPAPHHEELLRLSRESQG